MDALDSQYLPEIPLEDLIGGVIDLIGIVDDPRVRKIISSVRASLMVSSRQRSEKRNTLQERDAGPAGARCLNETADGDGGAIPHGHLVLKERVENEGESIVLLVFAGPAHFLVDDHGDGRRSNRRAP